MTCVSLKKVHFFFLHDNHNLFPVVFNHGCEFVRENNNVFYRGGDQTVVSNQKVDEWSKSHLMNLVMGWGCEENSFRIWSKLMDMLTFILN
jgi:hypothetical protein